MARRNGRSVLAEIFGVDLGAGENASPALEDSAGISAADATALEDKERAAERAVVESVAVTAAIAQGMRPKAAPLFVERVVDLSSIPVRGGEPDEKAVAQAVNQALQEYPELRRGGSKYGSAPAVR